MEKEITPADFISTSEKYSHFVNEIKASAEYVKMLCEEVNKNPKPSFRDIKKLIKEIARERNEPVSHILLETYSDVLSNRIIWQLSKDNEFWKRT